MAEPSFAEVLGASTDRCRNMDAPLADRLQAFAEDVRRLSPEFGGIVDRMVARLDGVKAGAGSPAPGEPMPSFLLPDQDGHLVSLEQLLGERQAVISFHRGHWCPYCRINASALADAEPSITAGGGKIVVITPEVGEFTAELRSDAKANFPVLSDLDNGYAMELNLAIWINDEKRTAMTTAGWDISKFQGFSNSDDRQSDRGR